MTAAICEAPAMTFDDELTGEFAAVIPAQRRSAECVGRWIVDGARSALKVSVKVGLLATVRGSFREVDGSAELTEDPRHSFVEVCVATNTLSSGNTAMDTMLRKAGIVDCVANPELAFCSTAIERTGRGWRMRGILQTAGSHLEISLDMTDPVATGPDTLTLRATGAIPSADAVRLLSHPGLESVLGRTMSLDLTIALRRG